MSTEHPILFSAPMVNAILAGKKTQTRRVAKCDGNPFPSESGAWVAMNAKKGAITEMRCPYGEPGDYLWVRETFSLESDVDGNPPPFDDGRPIKHAAEDDEGPSWWQPHYRATDPAPFLCCENANCRQCERDDAGPHWRPSIFMPRWASRIILKVTDVRLEGLNDISPEDAADEGWPGPDMGNTIRSAYPIAWYSHLWDQINGKRHPWESNPWVWVVCFQSAKCAEPK